MTSITSSLMRGMSADDLARIGKARHRLVVAGLATLAVYDSHLVAVAEKEELNDLVTVLMLRPVDEQPALLFVDFDTLEATLQMAIYIGLMLGSQYDFPAKLIALMRINHEKGETQS